VKCYKRVDNGFQFFFFLRKILGTRYGPDLSDFRDLTITFSDSRTRIGSLKHLKKTLVL